MDKEDLGHFRMTASRLAEQQSDSKNGLSGKGLPRSPHDPHSCLAKARAIFSCYRRDEAQDPDGFVANLAVVLGDYPASIVDIAADPRTGVSTVHQMGLPNVGQIRQFLEDKLSHREKLQRLAELPKPEFQRLPKTPAGPGDLANVFVAKDVRQYPQMVERAKTGDPREFRFVDGARPGIWVALSWFDMPAAVGSKFRTASTDEIRAYYAKPTDEGQGEAA
jgi:hypothetical protein